MSRNDLSSEESSSQVAECRFRTTTRDGHTQSVMCSNKIRSKWPSRASASLLRPAGAQVKASRTSASHPWPAGVQSAEDCTSASHSWPAGVQTEGNHSYAENDWKMMKHVVPDFVKEHTRKGRNKRKSVHRAKKRAKAKDTNSTNQCHDTCSLDSGEES